MDIKLKYKIGEKIKSSSHIYKVIGFEYVKNRNIRYILMRLNNDGKVDWDYLYDFEIEAMTCE